MTEQGAVTARGAAKVVVCGTGFGRVYLQGLDRPAGVLARGSERSRRCAQRLGVPLYTDPDQLPDDVDIAVVAVYAAVNGGPGSEIARHLMQRGVHVLQEGPLHPDELAESLRTAHRIGVCYHVSTHYVEVEPVRRFVAAAKRLTEPRYLDVSCSLQVFYHLFDILRLAVGLRPWRFDHAGGSPFRVLTGTVGGVPLTLRVQNQLHPTDPDNHAHLLHRITIGADGGSLTLADTHGPVLWSPRPHFPPESRDVTRLDEAAGAHLDYPSVEPLGPATGPSYREITGLLWPAAARRAVENLWRAVQGGEDPLRHGQAQLAVSQAWRDASVRLGTPELLSGPSPRPMSAAELRDAS